MAEDRRLFPTPRLVVTALLAGALAGAIAVYVRHGGSGNTPGTMVAAGESPDDLACAPKAEHARAVAAAATGEVAALMPADPPQSLKSLAFDGPDGQPTTLGELAGKTGAGKTVLLNLWATWCAPCREEMPALDALQREMGGDRFEVVAVNVDTGDDAKPRKFLADTGVASLGYYRDASMGVFNDLKKRGLALGLPATMLVDGDGCLTAHMNGPADWASPDAKRLVEAALMP